MSSVPETNGSEPEPMSPAPGVVTVGQTLHTSALWCAIKLDAPNGSLLVCIPPDKARGIGEALCEIGDAGQVILQKKPGLIVPGQDG